MQNSELVIGWFSAAAITNCIYILWKLRQVKTVTNYRRSPTYTKITNTVSTTTVFDLYACKWGVFALVGDLLQSLILTWISCNTVFSQNAHIRRGPSVHLFNFYVIFIKINKKVLHGLLYLLGTFQTLQKGVLIWYKKRMNNYA